MFESWFKRCRGTKFLFKVDLVTNHRVPQPNIEISVVMETFLVCLIRWQFSYVPISKMMWSCRMTGVGQCSLVTELCHAGTLHWLWSEHHWFSLDSFIPIGSTQKICGTLYVFTARERSSNWRVAAKRGESWCNFEKTHTCNTQTVTHRMDMGRNAQTERMY